MSTIPQEEAAPDERPVQQGDPGSLADFLAKRRAQLAAQRSRIITLPVNGYEERFAASYRRLPAEEQGDLVLEHQTVGSDSSEAVAMAADTLIRACTDLLEVVGHDGEGKPQYRSLGATWTAAWIARNFGVDLPDGVTTRNALLAALDSSDVLLHYADYQAAVEGLDKVAAEELPGESKPSAEGQAS